MEMPIIAVLLAFGLALLITPLVRKWAFKCGALDRPNQRKLHHKVMPRLGGLAIFISFLTAVLITREITLQVAGLLTGGFLIVLLGFLDDTRGVSPRVKLAGQVVAACAVIPFGLEVNFLTNPLSGEPLLLGFLSIPVTVLWIVSVTNAVNLIDGLDGLASGITCIASLTLAAVVCIEMYQSVSSPAQWEAVVLALILAAAVLGFLRYNFYPAKIFLGDTGSMFSVSCCCPVYYGLAKRHLYFCDYTHCYSGYPLAGHGLCHFKALPGAKAHLPAGPGAPPSPADPDGNEPPPGCFEYLRSQPCSWLERHCFDPDDNQTGRHFPGGFIHNCPGGRKQDRGYQGRQPGSVFNTPE